MLKDNDMDLLSGMQMVKFFVAHDAREKRVRQENA